MSKTLAEQKKNVENVFFNTLKGERHIRTAGHSKRTKRFKMANKEQVVGKLASYVSSRGLVLARPKSTKVQRVRGKNAFQKEGIVPRRKETRRRFEEYYMRSFNNNANITRKDLQASSKVYRHCIISKPNYLKYKLMREILEQKSLEEI